MFIRRGLLRRAKYATACRKKRPKKRRPTMSNLMVEQTARRSAREYWFTRLHCENEGGGWNLPAI